MTWFQCYVFFSCIFNNTHMLIIYVKASLMILNKLNQHAINNINVLVL